MINAWSHRHRPLLALLGLLLLAGCAPTEAETQASAATRTVEDVYGPVDVPADPQRVVVLWSRGLPELADALGVPLVGATTDGGTLSPLVSEETAAGVTSVGETAEPDLEKVAALDPDLIIAFDLTLEQPGVGDRVRAIAPTYAMVGTALFETPWRDVVRSFARGVNREAEAEALLADLDARIADLRPRLEERYAGQTIGVVADQTDGTPVIVTPTHVAGAVLDELGLQRPAGHVADTHTIVLSPERLREADADHLLYFYWGYEGEPEQLVANPLWPTLDSVRAGQAHEVDGQIWTVPVPTAVDGMLDDVERLLLDA
jgi:iron complex transport system substrate-binding protein